MVVTAKDFLEKDPVNMTVGGIATGRAAEKIYDALKTAVRDYLAGKLPGMTLRMEIEAKFKRYDQGQKPDSEGVKSELVKIYTKEASVKFVKDLLGHRDVKTKIDELRNADIPLRTAARELKKFCEENHGVKEVEGIPYVRFAHRPELEDSFIAAIRGELK